jgi:hypothetical protein
MVTERQRINLDLDSALKRRVKAAAITKGVSMRQFCVKAIERALDEHTPPLNQPRPFTREALEQMNELRERICQRLATSDSVELIRQARQERDEQVERAIRGY